MDTVTQQVWEMTLGMNCKLLPSYPLSKELMNASYFISDLKGSLETAFMRTSLTLKYLMKPIEQIRCVSY